MGSSISLNELTLGAHTAAKDKRDDYGGDDEDVDDDSGLRYNMLNSLIFCIGVLKCCDAKCLFSLVLHDGKSI